MIFSQIFQIPGLRKMNIPNSDSSFDQNVNAICRFFNKFWITKMYHDIYLRKTLFFEIFLEIMVFFRMNPP